MARAAVSERLRSAMNAHDIDSFVACFAHDYRSEQPAHPDRVFGGRDQVRMNWSAIFREVPDVQGDLIRSSVSNGEKWGVWRIYGTRQDGSQMEMRGVIISNTYEVDSQLPSLRRAQRARTGWPFLRKSG